MKDTKERQGYYLNGKKQVIEMLQFMEEKEKKKLLNQIGLRNPAMAKELSEQSLSFKNLLKAQDSDLEKIFQLTAPAIAGLALYLTPQSFQRRALKAMNRAKAEQAYNVMSRDLSDKKQECLKAQNRLLQNAIELSRRGIISL